MDSVIEAWSTVADAFGQRVGAVKADQWTASTPCGEWNVRELVDHAAGVQARIAAAIGAEVDAELGADPVAGWATMREAIEAALGTEGMMEKVIPTPFGERPVAEALGIPMMDLLVHTWDLSRAIGHDETLPAPIVAHAFESLQPLDGSIRQPGMFNEKVEVPAGSDLQTRFVAFTGRQP